MYRRLIRLSRKKVRKTQQGILQLLYSYDKLPSTMHEESPLAIRKENIVDQKSILYDNLDEFKNDLDTYKKSYDLWKHDIKILNTVKIHYENERNAKL